MNKHKNRIYMSGRNFNIYLQENLYRKLLPLIKERKASKFINEAIAEKLTQQKNYKKKKSRFEIKR